MIVETYQLGRPNRDVDPILLGKWQSYVTRDSMKRSLHRMNYYKLDISINSWLDKCLTQIRA
jgi:hypothetical protein